MLLPASVAIPMNLYAFPFVPIPALQRSKFKNIPTPNPLLHHPDPSGHLKLLKLPFVKFAQFVVPFFLLPFSFLLYLVQLVRRGGLYFVPFPPQQLSSPDTSGQLNIFSLILPSLCPSAVLCEPL
ncbi:hypothetical protein SAMN05421761_12020 [Belliella pelovolcani]|uniref:Uncharacterized protein n=1 Tax=Belliella pelovolcani TaxID=529505 RepID=A0A1N7PSN2_9BACT|nr:hypothetical protein SAMN05421761_12020 [Belliella pelovolcani]